MSKQPGPAMRYVKVRICQMCIDGKGQECHTPGCALFLHSVDLPIREELIEDVTPAEEAAPDLLDACIIARGAMISGAPIDDQLHMAWARVIDALDAAIAKARGE